MLQTGGFGLSWPDIYYMYVYIHLNIHHSRKQVRVKMRFLVLPCLGFFCICLQSLDRYVRWGVTIHDEIGKVAINSILSIHGILFFPRDSSSTPMGFGRFRHHKAKRNNGFQQIWYLRDFVIDDPRTRIWHPRGLRRLHLFVFTAMIDVPAFFFSIYECLWCLLGQQFLSTCINSFTGLICLGWSLFE